MKRAKFAPTMEEAWSACTEGYEEVQHKAGGAYSDGSVGGNEAPKGAPQAGSGLAAVLFKDGGEVRIEEIALLAAQVPGNQTVPRAELWAAILCVRMARSGAKA